VRNDARPPPCALGPLPRSLSDLAVHPFFSLLSLSQDVRVDTKLNKFLWSQGVKAVPGRVRVRFARKRNDDEEAAEKLYTLCMHVPVEKFQYKGLQTQVVEE
jgi:large subunit ribosomal protein L31e